MNVVIRFAKTKKHGMQGILIRPYVEMESDAADWTEAEILSAVSAAFDDFLEDIRRNRAGTPRKGRYTEKKVLVEKTWENVIHVPNGYLFDRKIESRPLWDAGYAVIDADREDMIP